MHELAPTRPSCVDKRARLALGDPRRRRSPGTRRASRSRRHRPDQPRAGRRLFDRRPRHGARQDQAQLPGAGGDPDRGLRGHAGAASTPACDRDALLRLAAARPGRAQHDPHAVLQQARPTSWRGGPADVPQATVTKVGVLGAGMMGAGIAYVPAQAGIEVVLMDATRGRREGQGLLARSCSASAREGQAARRSRPTPSLAPHHSRPTDYADLEGCELVIEAVFEDRDIKAEVTREGRGRARRRRAIFASNTSTLPITGLAEASRGPANFIGLHFFSPAEKMPLVEIILRQEDQPGDAGARARLRAADRQDADRRERQPRLLHQPRVRHLHRRGHGDAARGRRAGADRERRRAWPACRSARSRCPTRCRIELLCKIHASRPAPTSASKLRAAGDSRACVE